MFHQYSVVLYRVLGRFFHFAGCIFAVGRAEIRGRNLHTRPVLGGAYRWGICKTSDDEHAFENATSESVGLNEGNKTGAS